ncbi:MAG TPA: glycosyltransferase family 1 protein [Treponema sp.]|nr:glycosyltransferase family 1 protein [Treponema sp.]
MKVGIDTFGCDHGRSGIGSYLHSFTANLPQLPDVEFELFGSEIDRYTYTSVREIPFKAVPVPDSLGAERFWHFFKLNNFVSSSGYDVVLYPAIERVLPLSFRVPGIAVVNSIVSNTLREDRDWALRMQVKRGLAKAQKVIAPSQFVRKDLVRNGVDPDKIEVVHNGIDHRLFFPQMQIDAETVNIKPFAVKRPYFIYGSRLAGPDKKHIELIKAFVLFKERTHLPHRLVLAGAEGAYSEEVHKAAFQSAAASDIFLTGFFPHESFPQLYAGADACIFPSVNEGVGLPVLEAMATGIPVACSKAGALPEMGGPAAVYFDSNNIEEIAAAMEKIVTDSALREKMIADGIEWTKRFSWVNTVSMTIDVMKKIIKERRK